MSVFCKFKTYIAIAITIFVFSTNYLFSQDWKFHPDSLIEEDSVGPMLLNPHIEGYALERDYTDQLKSSTKYNGFRVQVVSTRSVSRAENIRMKLSSEIGAYVRVIFEAPNYKVRVGAFTDKQDAERMRMYLRSLGYGSAWVVRARINL